jgi:nucleotide-binding universal stress UspA family protein
VLNVVKPVTSLGGIRPPGGPIWAPPQDFLDSEQARLAHVAARVLGARPRVKLTLRVRVGDPLTSILEAARRADLVVLARTGRGALAHLVIGSIAEKVLRHAPVPVLTIGRDAATRIARRTRVRGRSA